MTPENLFHSLSLETIEDFVTFGREESLHLDFKLLKDASFASTDDKRNLAKALSGFGNSGGGVIVWGVDARKGSDGVDAATKLCPIKNSRQALTRLNALTGEAVEPKVDGVLHKSLEQTDGSGFLATLVPESYAGPHMAKLGEDRYFKRSGDSFYKMEHFDIADMFGRRRRPLLSFVYKLEGQGRNVQVDVGLRNNGRVSAKNVYLSFSSSPPFFRSHYGLNGNGVEGMKNTIIPASGYQYSYEGGADWVLHPGLVRYVARINLGLDPKEAPKSDLEIRYALACDDQTLTEETQIVLLSNLLPSF